MSRLRFPRTMDEAFKTPAYASAIERPAPKSRSYLWFAAGALMVLVALGVVK